jgi:hypothetical protein
MVSTYWECQPAHEHNSCTSSLPSRRCERPLAAPQVSEMKVVCEHKKVVVAQSKSDCEELLVEIVQDKRVADEQEKQVGSWQS